MALIETETDKSKLSEAIRLAEGQLGDLTSLAAQMLEDIKAGEPDAAKAAVKTAEELRRLVKLAIDLEARHERERRSVFYLCRGDCKPLAGAGWGV